MAETKDKVVTAESLKALHDYNKETYETKENIEILLNDKFDKPTDNIVPLAYGGTGSDNGATGLNNLFASGATVLSSFQYGDTFPTDEPYNEPHIAGRIFFKRLKDI